MRRSVVEHATMDADNDEPERPLEHSCHLARLDNKRERVPVKRGVK